MREKIAKRKVLSATHRTVSKHGKKLAKAAKTGAVVAATHSVRAGRATAKHTTRAARKAHYHVAVKPHNHLANNIDWYHRWHGWRWHKHVHVLVLAVYVFFVGSLLWSFAKTVFAADLVTNWDFADTQPYDFGSELETTGSSVRLKAQNYSPDSNTKALYHLDESSGSNVTDSSTTNNAATAQNSPSWSAGNLNNGLSLNGSNQFLSAPDQPETSLSSNNTIEAWTKFGSAFGSASNTNRQQVVDKGSYQLYYDNETGKVTYELANSSATTWTQRAGNDINRSWDLNGKQDVRNMVTIGTDVYAGLGSTTSDAEVWRWDGTSWSQVGGDGRNSSWADGTYELVSSMAANGTVLYVGLGSGAGDGEVWSCDTASGCATWTKIGGDGLNSGWAAATYESVDSMQVVGGNLYAGLGASAQDGEVWRWNGTAWTKVGGDGVNPGGGISWAAADNIETVYAMATDGTVLYVGLGATANDAEIWRFNPGTNAWTKMGGDSVNPGGGASWGANYEYVLSMNYLSNNLYVGLGTTADDAEVWRLNTSTNTWTKIGGDTLNSSWASATFEGVYSIANDGTNIYAGLGSSTGDAEVWRWNGSSWSKLGGDSANSSWATGSVVWSMTNVGTDVHVGMTNNSSSNAESWRVNGTTWTRTGGSYINKSWGYFGTDNVNTMTTYNDKLYAGLGFNAAGDAVVWEYDGSTWQVIGGQGVNSSWAHTTIESVTSMTTYNGNLYVGTGTTAGDGDVWRYNGSTWTQVGGDGLNGGWAGGTYETVSALTPYNGNLYAGLGSSAQDAEVYMYNGTTWSKVGGDGVNTSWTTGNNIEIVNALTVYNGNLYAGTGTTAGDGDVWRYNGSSWAQVGGDTLNSSWSSSTYEVVNTLSVYNNQLVAGLGSTTGDAEVWAYNGTAWTKIGGDGLNSGFGGGSGYDYEQIRSFSVYNGELYAATGSDTGDGDVWKWDGSAWSLVGGHGVSGSWDINTAEDVFALSTYKGKLYAGVGYSANLDAAVYSLGNNGYLQASPATQDTSWHHIAATYDGATMKLYIDGSQSTSVSVGLTMPDLATPLYIGNSIGSHRPGAGHGSFGGMLDEVRISNSARTGFTTKPYSTADQTVTLATPVYVAGVLSWDSFAAAETLNGGSVAYRLSQDGGDTWQYWDGNAWVASSNTTQSNPASIVGDNIATFPVSFGGITWQAVLSSDGYQQTTLDSVSLSANSDINLPETNASSIQGYKTNGGAAMSLNDWTNASAPYFSWTAGVDNESGVLGYCLYLGTDAGADPITTKGLLGTSPGNNGGNCQFMVTGTDLDLSTSGYLASPLTTSNDPYYLSVKVIDRAGNVYGGSSEQFWFRFDNTPPSNPGFITAPSGFINTKTANFTWPTTGGQAPSDDNAGLAGLQYRINNTTWYGDGHTGSGDMNDLLANDGAYTTVDPPDFSNISEGTNTVYFRTWDQAGNVSASSVTAALKINTNGAPSEPINLEATPTTNTANAFAFSWDQPVTFVGDANNLTYCYTINTLPSESTCTFTSAGVTSLGSGPYATQPGSNAIYLVAKDESGGVNYSSFATATFTANTPSPGIATSVDIVDVSIKATSNWRLALTWEPPAYVGAGVASYKVYRSTDNTTFAFVGSSSSTTYIDAGLGQQEYYYKVRACDTTNNCGAESSTVNLLPTGKFTTSASLTSAPAVSDITTKKARITWSTDRGSDSKIAIGTSSGQYGVSEVGNSSQVTAHSIDLDNLAAGTTYYFRAKWTDEDGNTGTSQEYSFRTSPAPLLKEVSTTRVTLSSGSVQFTSEGASRVNIYYGKSEGFGGLKTVNTAAAESTYNVELSGLEDGTKYFYKLSTFDSDGNEYQGNIFSFTTLQRPKISNIRFQPMPGEPTSTQSITWETNVPTTSLVIYTLLGGGELEVTDSQLKKDHKMIVKGLVDDSTYQIRIQGRDEDGNLASSDVQTIKTAQDTRPPQVSDVGVEVSIKGTGAEARGQAVIAWKTDEPSTSQVAYAEGSDAQTFNNKTPEDSELTTDHLIIVSDLPTSKAFSFKPLSRDKAQNEGAGEVQSAIVGKASDSVLTIILNSLQRMFGF